MELHEALLGRSLVAEHCAIGARVQSARESGKLLSKGLSSGTTGDATAGKLIIYADRQAVASEGFQRCMEAIKQRESVIASDIPAPETVITEGSPICTVITRGDSLAAVRSSLLNAANQIRRSLDPHPPSS
jgi:hypothetical protein